MPTGSAVIVPARLEHAFVLATTMRPKDVAELGACGLSPLEGLLQSVRVSTHAWALLYDDVVGAMFGVVESPAVLGRTDELWFLTGHLFAEKPLAFIKASKRLLGELLDHHPALGNAIDARHDDALRFAASLGAELGEPFPRGLQGEPFVPFLFRSV